MSENEIYTGEQVEQVFQLCVQNDMFDEIFEPKDDGLTDNDYKALAQMEKRRKALGKDFEPEVDEIALNRKFIKISRDQEFQNKKLFISRPEFAKAMFAILCPDKPFNAKTSYNDISRGLASLKTEAGL